MSFTRFTTGTGNISALSDRPNDTDGLTAAQLKSAFDKAGTDIKTYINDTLLPALEAATASGNIGIDEITGMTATTVQAALLELYTALQNVTLGQIPDGSIGTTQLADSAASTAKVADGAVTTAKLASSAVTTAKLADANVTEAKLASSSVTEAKLAAGAVTAGKIGASAVTEAKIASGAVTAGKIGSGAVTHDKIASNAVETGNIKDGAVTLAKTTGIQQKHTAIANVAVASISAGGTRQVSVSGVTASNTVLVTPAPSSFLTWRNCGVRCSAQGSGTLTFAAESATGTTLYANVVILN